MERVKAVEPSYEVGQGGRPRGGPPSVRAGRAGFPASVSSSLSSPAIGGYGNGCNVVCASRGGTSHRPAFAGRRSRRSRSAASGLPSAAAHITWRSSAARPPSITRSGSLPCAGPPLVRSSSLMAASFLRDCLAGLVWPMTVRSEPSRMAHPLRPARGPAADAAHDRRRLRAGGAGEESVHAPDVAPLVCHCCFRDSCLRPPDHLIRVLPRHAVPAVPLQEATSQLLASGSTCVDVERAKGIEPSS
jgi:hypothetical protein